MKRLSQVAEPFTFGDSIVARARQDRQAVDPRAIVMCEGVDDHVQCPPLEPLERERRPGKAGPRGLLAAPALDPVRHEALVDIPGHARGIGISRQAVEWQAQTASRESRLGPMVVDFSSESDENQ